MDTHTSGPCCCYEVSFEMRSLLFKLPFCIKMMMILFGPHTSKGSQQHYNWHLLVYEKHKKLACCRCHSLQLWASDSLKWKLDSALLCGTFEHQNSWTLPTFEKRILNSQLLWNKRNVFKSSKSYFLLLLIQLIVGNMAYFFKNA